MYNDIIKLLNEQFDIKIKKLGITKFDNSLYCYITLEKESLFCLCRGGNETIVQQYRNKKIKRSISTNNE